MTRRNALKLLGSLGLLPNFARLSAATPAAGAKEAAMAAATAAFGCNLFARLREKAGNLFFSPMSIETALAMTSVGARGETLAEMNKVLALPAARAHSGVGDWLRSLQPGPGAKYELAIANALWGQQGLPFHQEFLTATKDQYGATLNPVDFRQPDQARQTINHWVAENTKDKIKELFAAGSITPQMRLVLTNAIYFKGKWTDPFKKENTKDEPFKLAAGGTVSAPLMRRGGHFRYLEADGVQAVDLPYAGNKIAMLVVLPRGDGKLDAVEKSLTADKLTGWATRMTSRDGDVLLPRFKTTGEFELGDTLKAMGMRLAFSDAADFSGISSEPLQISTVVHKAFVETNEEGSEAAAATGVGIRAMAARVPAERFMFRADRPFLFVIRDVTAGTPLFVGRIANPV
jgi:serpin B